MGEGRGRINLQEVQLGIYTVPKHPDKKASQNGASHYVGANSRPLANSVRCRNTPEFCASPTTPEQKRVGIKSQLAYHGPKRTTSWKAGNRGHPANMFKVRPSSSHPKHLKPVQLVPKRAKWFKKWTSRALELTKDQAQLALRDHWPQHRNKILQGNRFLALQDMIKDTNCPDPGIVQEMMDGFNPSGNCGGGAAFSSRLSTRDLDFQRDLENES